jgi:hypothetical protein
LLGSRKAERFLAPLEMTGNGGLSSRTKREILAKLNHYQMAHERDRSAGL